MMNRHMQSRILIALSLAFALAAVSASARDRIPVHGPARVGVEDGDLLADTVLELGVLAIDQAKPTEIRIGDGITPGGIPIHPDGCVTGFVQIANATTNLNMHHYSIQWGAWRAQGDSTALNFTYGDDEVWLRFVRDSGEAYLSYDFTIAAPDVYQFTVASAEGDPAPVLQVATNLLEGYLPAPAGSYGTSRPDAAHLVITYTNSPPSDFICFRVFDAAGLDSGAYFNVPIVPADGITMGTNNVKEWTDLDYWFIPKWPGWYQFGNGGPAPSIDSIGLFSMFGGLYFQNVDNNISIVAKGNAPMSITPGADVIVNSVSGSVRIAAGMPVGQMPLLSRGLILGSTNGVVIDAPSVTWNGVSKHSWDDITAGVAAGVSSNAEEIAGIKENYLPKWPTWYRFGSGMGYPENTNTATGLWGADNHMQPDKMELALYDDFGGGSLNIYSRGSTNGPFGLPKLNLFSSGLLNLWAQHSITLAATNDVNIDTPELNLTTTETTITSTNATSGLTLTNSADGAFAVTWNGETRTGWPDTSGFVNKTNGGWTITQGATIGFRLENGDWMPVSVYTNTSGAKFSLFGGSGDNAYYGGHSSSAEFGSYATSASFGDGSKRSYFGRGSSNIYIGQSGPWGSVTNFHIYNNPTFDDGLTATSIAADSLTIGTNDMGSAVASVERRVSTLEMPETCVLFWPESYVHSNVTGEANFIDIPTNFPTKKMYLVVDDNDISPLGIKMDTWDPGRDVTIEIVPVRTTEGTTTRATYVRYNGLQAGAVTATNQYRIIRLQYDNIVRAWNTEQTAAQTRRYFFDAEGNRTQLPPESVPATVEEWLARYQELATP
jgi:hypothetical protein